MVFAPIFISTAPGMRVIRIVFEYKAIQIKWFGTHAEYDRTDVTVVKFKKRKL
jgi:mRNA-degrading endonuclease HigB of HigAB toxin-antitoxin module